MILNVHFSQFAALGQNEFSVQNPYSGRLERISSGLMKTDTIFYELFRLYPNLVLELVGASPSNTLYRFEAPEVKQAAFRFDGMLIPSQPGQPLYFIECQFQKDKNFYFRLFAEIAVYLKQKKYAGPWRAVVLFARSSLDPGVPLSYQDFDYSGRLCRLYLKPLQNQTGTLRLNILQLLVVPKPQMKRRVQQIVAQVEAEVAEAQEQEQMIDLVTTLLVYKYPDRDRRELEMAFGLKELSKTRVYQEAKEEGEQIGEERGKLVGKLEAKLEAVPALLDEGLSVEKIARVLGLTVEQVRSVTLPPSS